MSFLICCPPCVCVGVGVCCGGVLKTPGCCGLMESCQGYIRKKIISVLRSELVLLLFKLSQFSLVFYIFGVFFSPFLSSLSSHSQIQWFNTLLVQFFICECVIWNCTLSFFKRLKRRPSTRFLVEWFSCFFKNLSAISFFFSSRPSLLSHTPPLFLFHLCALWSLIINHSGSGWSFSIILLNVLSICFSEMTLRLFFSLALSPFPYVTLHTSIPSTLPSISHPSQPVPFSLLCPDSVSSSSSLLLLSLPCFYEISVNGSPACNWSRVVWLAHSVLHVGHLWAGLCDLRLYYSIPQTLNLSICASLPPSLSYHEAGGPHRGQSGAVGSRVRRGVRSVRLWR